MKTILTTLITFLAFTIVQASGFKDGVYTSDHGNIHLISSRSGSKAVGLYQTRGHILLSSFNINGRGTIYTGDFSNGSRTGQVAYTQINDRKWDGKWRFDGTPVRQWDGNWDGNFLTSTVDSRLYLKGTFETDLGTMELMHNESGKVGGFLYANGKEYYVYGKIGGHPTLEFSGHITSSEDDLKTSGPYTLTFQWKDGMKGKAKLPGQSQRSFKGAEYRKKVKITLINIKNLENTGPLHGEERGKVKIHCRVHDGQDNIIDTNLYNNSSNITWKEGRVKLINKTVEKNMVYTFSTGGFFSRPKLHLNFDYKKMRSISNAVDEMADIATIELKPILEYLEFKRDLNSFANHTGGRKKISGSDHSFWLGGNGIERKAKGYARRDYNNRNQWEYQYYIELVD